VATCLPNEPTRTTVIFPGGAFFPRCSTALYVTGRGVRIFVAKNRPECARHLGTRSA
jgi:hypothetical protein